MTAAVLSPLGTMRNEDEQALSIISPLFLGNKDNEPLKNNDDNDRSVPDLSDDLFGDFEMEQEKDDMDTPTTSFGGLNNLGNTCYLNSAVQMLASLDRLPLDDAPQEESNLRNELISVLERLDRGETVNPAAFKQAVDARSPLFVGYRQQDSHEFLATLVDLLNDDYKKKTSAEDETMEQEEVPSTDEEKEKQEGPTVEAIAATGLPTGDPFSASLIPSRPFTELQNEDICQLLHGESQAVQSQVPSNDTAMVPQCKLIGGRAAMPMSGMTPLDASEDELASAVTDSTQQCQDSQTEEETRDLTPLEEHFTTEVRATLTCESCKYTRSRMEKFLHLSLDVGSESGSVDEGLRKFFAPEQRQVKCEKCFGETATQTLEITKLPHALLIHCKRFIVDVSPDYSSVTYRKNQSPFSFGETLSTGTDGILDEFLAEDVDIPEAPWSLHGHHNDDTDMTDAELSYSIRSVVNHIGSSASCGHYTCDASRLYPASGERRWTRFNDSRVSEISTEDAMGATRSAYLVMYELD
jgi:ubiquitin C-terminal hydrolase